MRLLIRGCHQARAAITKARPRYFSHVGEDFVVRSAFPSVELSKLNLFDFVWRNHEKYAHRTAMVDGITGNSLNYEQSYQQCGNFARNLASLGGKRGDVMALLLPNCIEYALTFIGAPGVGIALTTMNPVYTASEIAKQLQLSGAKWAVTTSELYPKLKKACRKAEVDLSGRIFILGDDVVPGAVDLAEVLRSGSSTPFQSVPIDPEEDICCLPFSSGTTGAPKGVMLTHYNLVANICQETLGPREISVVTEVSDDEIQPTTVSVLPLYHIYAMNVTMCPMLSTGGKIIFLPKFETIPYIHTIEHYRPTFLHLAPPLVNILATNKAVTKETLSSLNHVMVAAAPSGPELIKKFKAKAPNVVYREGWGMSETSPLVMLTNMKNEVNGSVGALLPDSEAKVVDVSTGEALGPNKRGELLIRGPQVMKGYINNPAATNETLIDGWLHTGDIAMYDENGLFKIVDRLKELIKVKGFQVPPAELEDLLHGLPAIADVAVIGIPHEKYGEAPRAYIVVKQNKTLTKQEVHDFVEENAASYKQLVGGIQFMDAIPKSAAGKILRKELMKEYTDNQS